MISEGMKSNSTLTSLDLCCEEEKQRKGGMQMKGIRDAQTITLVGKRRKNQVSFEQYQIVVSEKEQDGIIINHTTF